MIAYRTATPADAAALARLGDDSFTQTFGHLYDPADLALFLETPTVAGWRAHRARRFYERYGFDKVGRYTFMVGAYADEDIVMRLAL